MSDIRSSEVAFTGFRFIRAHPGVIAIWAGVYLAVVFLAIAALIFMAGAEFTQLTRLQGGEGGALALSLLARLAPAFAVLGVGAAMAFAVVYAGAARAVLRPQEKAGAYLRLGADEWRQFLLLLLMGVVFLAAYIALIVAAALLIAGGAMVFRDAGVGGVILGILLGVASGLAAFCAAVYIAVRLSLASPLTFDRGRVDLFGSWALTKGRFRSLLGAYLLAWLLAMIVSAAAFAINLAVTGVGGGLAGLMQMGSPDMSSLGAYLSAAVVAGLVVNAIAAALMWPVMLMPASEAYRQIVGDNPADHF